MIWLENAYLVEFYLGGRSIRGIYGTDSTEKKLQTITNQTVHIKDGNLRVDTTWLAFLSQHAIRNHYISMPRDTAQSVSKDH